VLDLGICVGLSASVNLELNLNSRSSGGRKGYNSNLQKTAAHLVTWRYFVQRVTKCWKCRVRQCMQTTQVRTK